VSRALLRKAVLLLAPVLSAALWMCTPFHGSDDGTLGQEGGKTGDEAGDNATDGSVQLPLEGGPAAQCLDPEGTGNVTIVADPPSPHVGKRVTFQVTLVPGSANSFPSVDLGVCTPTGPIAMPMVVGKAMNGTKLVIDYDLPGGIPVAGVTQVHFLAGATFSGNILIQVQP
jgi:hypothetical protein